MYSQYKCVFVIHFFSEKLNLPRAVSTWDSLQKLKVEARVRHVATIRLPCVRVRPRDLHSVVNIISIIVGVIIISGVRINMFITR